MNIEMNIDHRDLINAYDLGHIEEHSPGMIHWHANGMKVMNKLRNYIRSIHENYDYQEVSSPMVLHKSLWERSGHWNKYQSNMFLAQEHGEEEVRYAIKPMSCPGQISIYQNARRSYKELPMRLFEFGHVHRNEPSGALSGWMRLRGFVQDDSHVFIAPNHIEQVIADFIKMVEEVYHQFGFEHWDWQISLRPEQRAGSDEIWDQAEEQLRQACRNQGLQFEEKAGEGAFYGPKLEVAVKDRLGRSWQCGVAQVDFVLPERFELEYQNNEQNMCVPVIIHHAILGSLERFMSIVLEHEGQLPLWLAPQQVVVCPISEKHQEHAQMLCDQLKKKHIAASVLAGGPLNGRLRQADQIKAPYRVVIGDQEINQQKLSWRLDHDKIQQGSMEDFLKVFE